jgi:hypothetical protein
MYPIIYCRSCYSVNGSDGWYDVSFGVVYGFLKSRNYPPWVFIDKRGWTHIVEPDPGVHWTDGFNYLRHSSLWWKECSKRGQVAPLYCTHRVYALPLRLWERQVDIKRTVLLTLRTLLCYPHESTVCDLHWGVQSLRDSRVDFKCTWSNVVFQVRQVDV